MFHLLEGSLSSARNFTTAAAPILLCLSLVLARPLFQLSLPAFRVFPRGKGQRISFRDPRCPAASLSAITTPADCGTLIVTWQPNRMDRGGLSCTWTLEREGANTDGVKSAGTLVGKTTSGFARIAREPDFFYFFFFFFSPPSRCYYRSES